MSKEKNLEPQTEAINNVDDLPKSRPSKKQALKSFLKSKKGKIITICAGVVLVVGIFLAIPATRYAALGFLIKKDATITVIDSVTGKPVTDALVSLGVVSTNTDSKGSAHLKSVGVGEYQLKISKKYYRDYSQNYNVPILSTPSDVSLNVQATGRQVLVSVSKKIGGEALSGATVEVSGTTATTDTEGKVNIVLPAEPEIQKGTISSEGYNTQSIEVQINGQDNSNNYSLTPSGSLFYLSKQTGKIDVMKSDLDGSNSSVVLKGTGNEDDSSTVLLAARDWMYLALISKRDSNQEKLYLIDTATGKLTVIDEGAESYELIGWSGHNFIYTLTRKTANFWDDKKRALKIFNAETSKIALIDQTVGSGTNSYNYQYENIHSLYILNNEVVYAKTWALGQQYIYQPSDKKMSLLSVSPETGNKKVIKDFPQTVYGNIQAKLYKPQELYIRTDDNNGGIAFYEYEHGAIASTTNTNDTKFSRSDYPTHLISPSGKKTFWFEPRDGKNTIFIGDDAGSNSEQIATLSDFTPYGWYGDDYTLFSKSGSELYIASAHGVLSQTNQPIKVTDYHKPQLSYPSYGYGYGGL